jgi:hypothetical protein
MELPARYFCYYQRGEALLQTILAVESGPLGKQAKNTTCMYKYDISAALKTACGDLG